MVYDRARRDKTENVGESLLDLSQASFVRVDEERAGATVSGVTVKRVLMQNTSESTFLVQKKMQQIEDASKAEREWLLNMCPKGGGSTYGDGKELFTVRLMVNFLLQENEAAVRELHSLELVHSEGEVETVSAIPLSEDNSREGVLRKPIDERPFLSGLSDRRCYGCGCLGHLRGDPECSSKDKAVWTGAPERFKRKVNECNQPLPERGESEVVVTRKVLPIVKRGKAASKVPCRNWLYGNGTCKYAEQCRYSHDAYAGRGVDFTSARVISEGEQQPQDERAPGGFTKLNGAKEANNVYTRSSWCEDYSGDESRLYHLVQGAPAVIVGSKAGAIVNDFVPKRNLIEPSVFIGSKIPKTDERRFFIGGKGCFWH